MNKRQWKKVEPILDETLSISNDSEREEFIEKSIDNEKLQKEVLKWLRAIQEADEVGFMEEWF